MAEQLRVISDDTYTFSETENKNQFFFYRNDRKEIDEDLYIVADFLQNYIICKMLDGEVDTNVICGNLSYEISDDKKYIRLTVLSEKLNMTKSEEKRPNLLKRIVNKLFK